MSKIYGRPVATPIKLTAEQVGARPADWTPTAEEVGATPASHAKDKNNPHGVTAEQVGARPNTWTPTAGDVGARPDTWMPTAAEVGAAKSGFGLGELRGKLITDCNEALENGWYYSNGNCANAPNEHAFTMLVMTSSGYTQTQIVSLGNNFSRDAYLMARKNSPGNGWSEWKQVGKDSYKKVLLWENPNLEDTFDAQKIELDLSDYDGVEVVTYADQTTGVYQNSGFVRKGLTGVFQYSYATQSYRLTRTFTVSDTGVDFATATNTGTLAVNKLAKPYLIYGIKNYEGSSDGSVGDIPALDGAGNVAANAVLYTEQFLTEEQKAQARENIGIDSVSNSSTNTIFNGKTASFYGDSLTEVNSHYTKGYYSWVKDLLGLASYNNYGVSGYKIADVYRKVNSVTDTADIIFVMCGVNDQTFSVPLGAMGDDTTDTIYGSLSLLCALLKQKYPTKLVVFITPHYQTKYPHNNGITSYEVSKAIKEVCEKYAISVYDNFVLSGIYSTNFSAFTTDNCHWNDTAHEMVGKNLARFVIDSFRYVYGYSDNTSFSVNATIKKAEVSNTSHVGFLVQVPVGKEITVRAEIDVDDISKVNGIADLNNPWEYDSVDKFNTGMNARLASSCEMTISGNHVTITKKQTSASLYWCIFVPFNATSLPLSVQLSNVAVYIDEVNTPILAVGTYKDNSDGTYVEFQCHTHSYHETVTAEAMCITEGVKTFTCECGFSYTESIPATGHNYVGGVCSICGEKSDYAYAGHEVSITGSRYQNVHALITIPVVMDTLTTSGTEITAVLKYSSPNKELAKHNTINVIQDDYPTGGIVTQNQNDNVGTFENLVLENNIYTMRGTTTLDQTKSVLYIAFPFSTKSATDYPITFTVDDVDIIIGGKNYTEKAGMPVGLFYGDIIELTPPSA